MPQIKIFRLASALLGVALGACSGETANPRESIRLSPEAVSATGLDGTRLVDRDTSVPVSIAGASTVTLRFRHEVEIRRVKVHGARAVAVGVPGLSLGEEGEAGWASGTLSGRITTRDLVIALEPTGPGAQLDELEVWGAGRDVASGEVATAAEATRGEDAWERENVWALRATPAAATLRPGAGADGACLRARFPSADPHQARRAYLVFEANVPRPVALRHSFGGAAPSSGFWLGAASESSTHVQEIDPEQLRGGDELLLCLPDEADAEVTVQGVRLLLLLDDGREAFERGSARRFPGAVDRDDETAAPFHAGPQVVELERPRDVESAELVLARVPARLEGLTRLDGASVMDHGTLELQTARTNLPVRGRTSALRVAFAGPARADAPAALVSELALAGSGVGPRIGAARIVLVYPVTTLRGNDEVGERFGPKAYLLGWAESPAGRGTVEIDGARVDVDGAFSELLRRPLGVSGPWAVTLRARFPDGSVVTRTVSLDDDREGELLGRDPPGVGSEDLRFGRENQTSRGTFDPAGGGKVALGTDVYVEVPAGAVASRTAIGITRKGHEVMPRLDPGMINVTAPAHAAYRFVPKGQRFAKPVKVVIPYDPELLPEGVLPEEVQTYYFDEAADRWLTLPRREVLRGSKQVVSETTHFTFMINAVLVLPDHPGPVSFNPNSIKDLKAADPSAGIDLVEPPQGNDQGTARLSFPVRLPKARGAYQPSLAIAYDSSNGNGWLGVGWDVAVSRVTIDGRNGVPEYLGEERYLLDGEAIVPVGTLGAPPPAPACVDGAAGRAYTARVQRDFRRILRCGADPSRYWFEVTDKAGTLFVYGHGENARLASYVPRVVSPPAFPPTYDIAEWYLERVVDANGNLTEYAYQHDSPGAADPVHREPFRQAYLRAIQYSGAASRRDGGALAGGTSGVYLVELLHEPGSRSDEVTSARAGFKTVVRRRLGSIEVRLLAGAPSGLIRRYDLSYRRGDLGKSLLDQVVVRGADEKVFYAHRFEYEEKAPDRDGVTLFGPPVPWVMGDVKDWGLSASRESAYGFHGFVGIGLTKRKANASVGLGFGFGRRRGETLVSTVDLNGDGLPDRVYGGPADVVLFNAGAGQALTPVPPPWDPGALLPPELYPLDGRELGKDSGNTFDLSVQAFYGSEARFGGSLNIGAAYATSSSKDFVLDANGDGLPDFVNDGKVYFNQPRSASCPAGSTRAECCPAGGFCFLPSMAVPALGDLGDSAELVDSDPAAVAARREMEEALTPEDAVLEWTAPYAGAVDVSGQFAFVSPVQSGERRDGVRLRVYRYDPLTPGAAPEEQGTWLKTPGDATDTPVTIGNVQVSPGTILYFVLSTLSDFPMNAADGNISPVELVRFAPVIAYRGVPAWERDVAGPAGAPLHRFDAEKDFVLAGDPQGAVSVPLTGRLALDLGLTKLPTSDAVRICVQYQDPPADEASPPPRPGACSAGDAFYQEYAPEQRLEPEQALAVPEVQVKAGGTLYFRVDTDVAIVPKAVTLKVAGVYACAEDPDGRCVAPDRGNEDERNAMSFRAVPYVPLHTELVDLSRNSFLNPSLPWRPSGQVLRPFKVTKPGTIRIDSRAQYATRDVPIHFTVRTVDKLVFKATGDHGSFAADSSQYLSASARLEPGDLVFFEGHSESARSFDPIDLGDGASSGPAWELSCSFQPDEGRVESCGGLQQLTSDGRADEWDGNKPILAGGFHGWRYGAWNGKDGEAFSPWVYRGPTKAETAGWEGNADDVVDTQSENMQREDDPQRIRLRLAGLLVPSTAGTVLALDGTGFESAGNAFVSQDGNTYFTAGRMHAGRKGESASNRERDPDGATVQPLAFRIGKIGRSAASLTLSGSASIGVDRFSAGASLSAGLSQQKLDVLDMNGDGILDVVVGAGMPNPLRSMSSVVDDDVSSHVRVTSPTQLSTRRTVVMNGFPQLTRDVGGTVNLGASAPLRNLTPKGDTRAMQARFPGFGGGLAFSVGSVLEQLADVNGDGLPDAVRVSTSGCGSGMAVHLNMGTSFAAAEDCLDADPSAFPGDSVLSEVGIAKGPALRRSNTVTLQGTAGADLAGRLTGGTDRSEAFGASLSAETSLTATNVALVDVTGDGLPDYVYKRNAGDGFVVRVNTGYGFAPPRTWHAETSWSGVGVGPRLPRLHLGIPGRAARLLGAFTGAGGLTSVEPLEATGSHSTAPAFSFAVNFSFPVFLVVPWIHVGGGASFSRSKVSGFELGLMDLDGDGLPDQVLKTSDEAPVWARLNQLGKANLLRRVVRPLGGSIDLAYEQRLGNTVEMPLSRWVLTKVVAHDGRSGGAGHDLETRWAYEHGRYDRSEREFLGFEKVTRTNPDGTWVEQRFRNDAVLTRGLLVSETLGTGEGSTRRPLVETVSSWSDPISLVNPDRGCTDTASRFVNAASYCGSFFTKLDAVEKRFYESEPRPGIVTRQDFTYDGKGDVVGFGDAGDVADRRDDLRATIVYAQDAAAGALHSVSRPERVEVRDAAGVLLRSRSARYDGNGNLEHFEAPLGDGRIAATDLHWNSNGTLDWVKGPENETAQRYETHYGYDGVTASYVTAITDSHGYASSAEYDHRFGEATRTTDVNGKVTRRKLDAFGRLTHLAGPRDTLDAPTVWISYAHEAPVPYAWTHNRLPRQLGDTRGTVDTVVLMDGFGRVIQTKKTAEIATSDTAKGVGWSVSGHQLFDEMGRVAVQGQTFASFGSRPELVPGTPVNPTRLAYDLLGRMKETLEPDGSATRVEYGFGTPAGSLLRRFKTTTTDAEGKSRTAYKDAGDRVVAVEERIEGRTPTTHYEYSPVGELTQVVDAAGNTTRLEYDLLGRRTKLVNPDTGELRFLLDLAGNLVRKYDPNLVALQGNQSIHYVYDYDQLVRIEYPDASRNVTYAYGSATEGADRNGIGRVIEVKDDAGSELRGYGELGELTSTTRILRPILPGDRERTFTTSFAFDSFGRMMNITYPDGETVEYAYDAGGLLESATGHRPAGGAVPADEIYLSSMMYDAFGQRVRMVLGNGVVSKYAYEPLTRRLASLTTTTPLGRTLQAITYAYDRVGNVKTLVNGLGEPVGDRSGTVTFQYGYDDLYRLTSASGEAKSRAHTIDRYTASYAYSDVHNMTSNVQLHEIVHGGDTLSVERPPKTNHDFAYTYDPAAPHRATKIGNTFLVYDGNGNTIRECRDTAGDPTCGAGTDHRRTYAWTAENRLEHVIDGGGRNVTRFLYDAGGDRVVKLGRGGEAITVGQFWSLKGRRAATKHVFAGATRLASKLLPPPGWDPAPSAAVTSAITVAALAGTTTAVTASGATNDNGCDPSNYQPTKCPVLPGGDPSVNHQYDDTRVRPETYYYHPDHLGSTSWVTDQHARVHEHVEYFPYGEVWRDPRSDADGGPVKGQRFLFTGKEMDEETGLQYFGARYYDPLHARWHGTDPIAQNWTKAPDPGEVSLYTYALWSPQRYADPDGADPVESRILQDPKSAEYLERSGLLDRVDVGYLQQHGLLRDAVELTGGQLDPNQPDDLLEVEKAFLFDVFPLLVGVGVGAVETSPRARTYSERPAVTLDQVEAQTALVKYDPEFAAQQILGRRPVTPGGRTITPHAAERMTSPPPGRARMTMEEIDQVLDKGTRVRKISQHPLGDTVTVQHPGMPGRPQVVVDAETGKRVITVIKNE